MVRSADDAPGDLTLYYPERLRAGGSLLDGVEQGLSAPAATSSPSRLDGQLPHQPVDGGGENRPDCRPERVASRKSSVAQPRRGWAFPSCPPGGPVMRKQGDVSR